MEISMSGISSERDGDTGGEEPPTTTPISSSLLKMSMSRIALLFSRGWYAGEVGLTTGKTTRGQTIAQPSQGVCNRVIHHGAQAMVGLFSPLVPRKCHHEGRQMTAQPSKGVCNRVTHHDARLMAGLFSPLVPWKCPILKSCNREKHINTPGFKMTTVYKIPMSNKVQVFRETHLCKR